MASLDKSKVHPDKQREKHWIKASRALKYTVEGIRSFVNDIIEDEHKRIIASIQHKIGSNVLCKTCSFKNLKPDHSKTDGRCPYNQKRCNCLLAPNKAKECAHGVCGILYDEIINLHRFRSPNWQNVNPDRWCCDAWEIAKCFISVKGYKEKTSASVTDLSALLHVITNNMVFQSHIDCIIDPPNDIFSKIRKVRDDLFHSANHEIDQDTVETYLDLMIAALEDKKELCNKKDAQEATEKIKKLKTEAIVLSEAEEYLLSKKDLQTKLIQMYLKYYGKVSVHPLISSHDKSIDEIYVQPDIVSMPVTSDPSKVENIVEGYHGIFMDGNEKFKRIYLTGDAGLGKSAFCDEFVMRWCHVWSKTPTKPSQDETILLMFEFVFLIRLNISKTEDHIHDMIKSQLVQDPSIHHLLDQILRKNSSKCLILLDGLDEWCPNTQNKSMPKEDRMMDYVTFTTTRPWKLDIIKIKWPEIDRHIKLLGLGSKSSHIFIESIVSRLNTIYKQNKKSKRFLEALATSGLKNLGNNPILLQQLICLWHSGKTFGTSQCELYSKMVEFLLEFSEERNLHDSEFQDFTSQSTYGTKTLPACLHDLVFCRQYSSLIESLAYVAFTTLIKENTDAFERVFVKDCGLNEKDIEACLKVGLLTQYRYFKPVAKKNSSIVTFSHKTFQEFFAAIHLATNTVETDYGTTFFSIDKIFDSSKLLVFSCGMSEKAALSFSRNIQKKTMENQHLQNYRRTISCQVCKDELGDNGCTVVNRVQEIVFACAKEYSKSKCNGDGIQLVDIVIDNETDPTGLHKLDLSCLKSVTVLNLNSVASFVIVQSRNLQKITIPVSNVNINMFLSTHICHMIRNSIVRLEILVIDIDIFYFKEFGSDNSYSTVHMNHFISVLKQLSSFGYVMRNLKLFSGGKKYLRYSDIGRLLKVLGNFHRLEVLNLSDLISNQPSVQPSLRLDIINLARLKILECDGVSIHDIHLQTNVLDILKLSDIPVLENALFLERLQYSKTLTVLHLRFLERCSEENIVSSIHEVVPTLTSLRSISLWKIDFGSRELRFSGEMQDLQTVELGDVRLSMVCFDNLIDSLPLTKHILEVILQSVIISNFGNDLYIRKRLSERKHQGTVKVNVYNQNDFYMRMI